MAKTKEEIAEYQRRYYAENKLRLSERIKERRKKYYLKNKEKTSIQVKQWRDNNPEKRKASKNKSDVKAAASLATPYVIRQLKKQGFPREAITPELIELKRITLKTTRLCRQLKA